MLLPHSPTRPACHPGSGLPLPTETTFQRKKSERHAPQSHGLSGSCPTGAWAEGGCWGPDLYIQIWEGGGHPPPCSTTCRQALRLYPC